MMISHECPKALFENSKDFNDYLGRSGAYLFNAKEDKLADYNETYSIMDLVLFDTAIMHVCRIARILSFPGGNALLVGVGGSGKQSLSKLAAHICKYEISQIAVTADYGINDLKTIYVIRTSRAM